MHIFRTDAPSGCIIRHYMKMTRFPFWWFIHNTRQFWKYVKGVPYFQFKYTKAIPFCQSGIQNGKELDLGAEPPCLEHCRVPSTPLRTPGGFKENDLVVNHFSIKQSVDFDTLANFPDPCRTVLEKCKNTCNVLKLLFLVLFIFFLRLTVNM